MPRSLLPSRHHHHDPFYRPAAPSLHDDNLPSPPCQFLPPAFSIDLHGVPFPRNLIYLPAHPSTPIGCYRSPLSSPHIPIISFFFFSSLPARAYTSASPLPDQFITITSNGRFLSRPLLTSALPPQHPSSPLVGLKILVKRLLVRKVNRNIFFIHFCENFAPLSITCLFDGLGPTSCLTPPSPRLLAIFLVSSRSSVACEDRKEPVDQFVTHLTVVCSDPHCVFISSRPIAAFPSLSQVTFLSAPPLILFTIVL